jgi:hypothetical protein
VAKPDPTRNIPYQFPADKFRNAVRFLFEMESPPEDEARITFHFAETVTYAGAQDSEKVPFDPAQAPTRTVRTPVNVPCDITFKNQSDEPTAFGTVVPATVTILLLDEDYAQVADAAFVIINGDRYMRHYEEPSFGLFDVGLHTMVFVAENEL